MNPETERLTLAGAAGKIEVALEWPTAAPRGLAFIAHPHPLYGGTMDNKVITTLARTFVTLGYLAVRLNFRGVGASEGMHDHGVGETDDFLQLIDSVPSFQTVQPRIAPNLPVMLAGFSFGSYVAARATQALTARGEPPAQLLLVGTAAGKWPMPTVPPNTFLIHGEQDDTIPLADVFEWARPQELAVTVLPGADHFFHRRLSQLKRLILIHVQGSAAIDGARQTP